MKDVGNDLGKPDCRAAVISHPRSVAIWRTRWILRAVLVLGLATPALSRPIFPEVEGNSTKAEANVVTLGPGDAITGTTTGTITSGAAMNSADYFRIKTAAAALGIYRHELVLTSATPGQIGTIRGLSQSGGVIGTTDVAVQTSSPTSGPPNAVAWYGFGKQEEIYYRVTGSPSTTGSYTAILTTTPVIPVVAPGVLLAGPIAVSTTNVGASTADTDLWLYDSGFNAINGAGNDDDSSAATASSFSTNTSPGTYYEWVSFGKGSNNKASVPPDTNLNDNVMDFANVVVSSTVNPTTSDVVDLIFRDVNNSTCTTRIMNEPGGGGVGKGYWVCKTVQLGGACCNFGCCMYTSEIACTGTWIPDVSCTPSNPCPPPGNDDCNGATALSFGVRTSGGNCNATVAGGELAPACQTSHSKSVWFTFTPSITSSYRISACGSTFDSVLTVFAGTCAAPTQIACDDDTCDGITPPGSASASVIAAVSLTAGTAYKARVSSFGSSAGGPIALTVTSDVLGACCRGSTCAISALGTCTGTNTHYAGNGTLCNVTGNNTVPCCRADFNHSGAISVQDIFDFLAAYFANNTQADFNGTGTLSVQDIFDFLAGYFTGCT